MSKQIDDKELNAISGGVTNGRLVYQIDQDVCVSCGQCAEQCPVGCITENDVCYEINEASCIGCGVCVGDCPINSIKEVIIK